MHMHQCEMIASKVTVTRELIVFSSQLITIAHLDVQMVYQNDIYRCDYICDYTISNELCPVLALDSQLESLNSIIMLFRCLYEAHHSYFDVTKACKSLNTANRHAIANRK